MLLINLIIASLFFIKNIGVGYSQLSSDMHNIVPMCMKLDDSTLYTSDLYLSDTNNFKFYTPFFIETLRFIGGIYKGDYVKASNLLLFVTSLIFGVVWFFLLFKIFLHRFWIALLISILMRGIVWLPMWEFFGISDLWTIVPRTVYIALMPIPFLLLYKNTNKSYYLAAFLIGFIFNFHPISGLGGILIYVSLVGYLYISRLNKNSFNSILFGFLFLILGMLPFIFTYFSKTDTIVTYDLSAYQTAFNSKIPSRFQQVGLILNSWLKFKFLFFFIPFVIFLGYSFLITNKYRNQASALLVVTFLLFTLPILSIYIEQFLNDILDLNLRMSFQIVRIQKLSILSGYVSIGFLLILFLEKYNSLNRYLPYLTFAFLFLLSISTPNSFKNTPFLGDDISRSILPTYSDVVKPISDRNTDFDQIAEYIEKNTPISSTFFNNYYLRSAAKRSVKFDGKGANILIEGNPKKLIEWHKSIKYLKNASIQDRIKYLKQNGVDYILTDKIDYPLPLEKQIGKQKLYNLN